MFTPPGTTPSPGIGTATDPYAALSAATDLLVSIRANKHALDAIEATVLAAGREIASRIAETEGGKDHGEFAHRMVAAELGLAVRETDRTMAAKIDRAVTLVNSYPGTHDALIAGRVSQPATAAVTDCGTIITDPALRARYEEDALKIAEREVVGRLRPLLRELAEQYADTSLDERHREADERRCVQVQELDDGMSCLTAILSTPIAHGIKDRLNQMAKRVKLAELADRRETRQDPETDPGAGELLVRSTDQIRADLFTDMLLCADPGETAAGGESGLGAIRARVQVVTPQTRLARKGQNTEANPPAPASLSGAGPIDTDTARHLASNPPSWDEVVIHPGTGAVITVDTYRPSAEQRRYLRARDQHCRYPGCRTPLDLCDIDHTVDAALGGETSTTNLAHLCRRHHMLKHQSTWTVTQNPDGTLRWRSPTGRNYEEPPPSTVRFQEYTEPEPGSGSGSSPDPDPPHPL